MSAIVHLSANGIIQLPPAILALVQPAAVYEIAAKSGRVLICWIPSQIA